MNIRQMAEQQIALELSEFFKARKLNSSDVRLLLDGLFMVDPNAKVWESNGQLFISDFPFKFCQYKGTAIEMIEDLTQNGKLKDHDHQYSHAHAYLWAAKHQTSTEMLAIVAGYFTHKKHAITKIENTLKGLYQVIECSQDELERGQAAKQYAELHRQLIDLRFSR